MHSTLTMQVKICWNKMQTYKGFWHEAPARGCESATTCKTENNSNVTESKHMGERGGGWWLRR